MRTNRDLGLFGPDQNLTVLTRQLPRVHKFELQVLKARVVQFEYPAERAARDALLALEQRRSPTSVAQGTPSCARGPILTPRLIVVELDLRRFLAG